MWPLSAAASTFANGVQGYDWESLAYAVGTALVGAAFKTAFTLSSTRVAVLSVLRELWRDGIAAAIAGVVMYLAIGAWGAAFTPPHFLLAMPLLFAAGWARGAFLTWTEGRATSVADSAVENLKDRLRKTIVGEEKQRRGPRPTRAATSRRTIPGRRPLTTQTKGNHHATRRRRPAAHCRV